MSIPPPHSPDPDSEGSEQPEPEPAQLLARLLGALENLFDVGEHGAGLPPEDPEITDARLERLLDGLRAGFPHSPVPSDSALDDDELPFTAFGQFGYGSMDLRVFDQQRYWVDVHGRSHQLIDMEDDYISNVIAHLHTHATSLHLGTVRRWAITRLTDALDGTLTPDAEHHQPHQMSPHEWLDSTPLMKALRARQTSGPSRDDAP